MIRNGTQPTLFWRLAQGANVRRALVVLTFILAGTAPMASGGEADGPTKEFKVKAAFLFNFALFTEWPEDAFPSPKAPFCIGVLGKDPFGDILEETLKGKMVSGRPIEIRRFKDLKEYKPCHILFVGETGKDNLETLAKTLKSAGVLTVSDIQGFAEKTGILQFRIIDNRVRFEINLDAANRARLKISSKLLKVAEKVIKDEAVPNGK